MYDLKDLSRWHMLAKGSKLEFPNEERRKVRLEVISEGGTILRASQKKGAPMFLGVFSRFDVVQFQVDGPWTLHVEGDRCYIWTPELTDNGMEEIPEAVSFTKIMNRRVRNPEMELMMKKVGDNMERRIAQVSRDVGLVIAQERRAHARELEDQRQSLAAAAEAAATAASGSEDDDGDGEPI